MQIESPRPHKYVKGEVPVLEYFDGEKGITKKLNKLAPCKVCGFWKGVDWHVKDKPRKS